MLLKHSSFTFGRLRLDSCGAYGFLYTSGTFTSVLETIAMEGQSAYALENDCRRSIGIGIACARSGAHSITVHSWSPWHSEPSKPSTRMGTSVPYCATTGPKSAPRNGGSSSRCETTPQILKGFRPLRSHTLTPVILKIHE